MRPTSAGGIRTLRSTPHTNLNRIVLDLASVIQPVAIHTPNLRRVHTDRNPNVQLISVQMHHRRSCVARTDQQMMVAGVMSDCDIPV
jgi:hypothetical protein